MAFKLKANPTFKAKVGIPIPGGEPEQVEFEFRHRTVDGLAELREQCAKGMSNREIFDAVVVGWGLSDEFNHENTDVLLQNYPMAARAIFTGYIDELTNARLGN
jgi:hypothetical protein